MNHSAGRMVVLSDSEPALGLVETLIASGSRSLEWYTTLEELLRARPLSSIAMLVVVSHPLPKGILLMMLGRIALEYPAMQKVAVMDAAPPLPIAEYLTSCGVDMVWTESGSGEDTIERLAAVVHDMNERSQWIAA